jgi:CHASE2 domain-containing sensor protein
MWFERGTSVGAIGRTLSGLETMLMYVIEALAFVTVWRERRRESVWLLLSISLMGVIALGLVVLNVGTLYRLRFTFFILFVILAAVEIARFVERADRIRTVREHAIV